MIRAATGGVMVAPPTTSPDLAPAGVDVILSVGQSNDVGFGGDDLSSYIDPLVEWTNGRLWQWSADGGEDLVRRDATGAVITDAGGNPLYDTADKAAYANTPLVLQEPLRVPRDNINWSRGYGPSPVARFARSLLFFTPADRHIFVISAGIPGSGLVGSGWARGGIHYNRAVATANACIAHFTLRGIDARLRVIDVGQGENEAQDTTVTPAAYQAAFDAMLAGLRTDIANAAGAIVLVQQMVPDWIEADPGSEQRAAIDAVHRLAPVRLPRTWFVHGPRGAYKTGDAIHYAAGGSRALGDRAFLKLRAAIAAASGTPFTAPTGLAVLGTRLTWNVPSSDAPAFAVETRPAGSTGPFTRLVVSPADFHGPGEPVSHTFTALGGDIEARVAAIADGSPGPFSETVVVPWRVVPAPLSRLDLDHASLSGLRVSAVPSTGTDTAAWTAPTGREPLAATHRGRRVLRTDANAFLQNAASLPPGSYTIQVLVSHADFSGAGGHVSAADGFTDFLLWRQSTQTPARVFGGQNGDGALTTGPVLAAGRFYAFTLVLDLSTGRQRLHVDGRLVDERPCATRNALAGLVLNATSGSGGGGNRASYAGLSVWSGALDEAQVAQEAMIAAAERAIALA